MIAIPKIVVLDTATLGGLSRDYWSADTAARNKARSFVAQLPGSGVVIAFTLDHIVEVLAHRSENIVRERLAFLSSLPLIAWLRPYDCSWFPGSIVDLLSRELHSVVHCSAKTWCEITDAVRPHSWETGTGSEMFVEDGELWSALIRESRQHQSDGRYIASVARTDAAKMSNVTLGKAFCLPRRSKEEQVTHLRRFAKAMEDQLRQHGDKRLESPREVARHFAHQTGRDIQAIEGLGGDPIQQIITRTGIPTGWLRPEMTVAELGELAVYVTQLSLICQKLKPPMTVAEVNLPPDRLPSFALTRRLSALQRKAQRVSGSDLGDGHIAPLIFYADSVQVDKRTKEYLNQLRRREPEMAALMGHIMPDCDYSQLPSLLVK